MNEPGAAGGVGKIALGVLVVLAAAVAIGLYVHDRPALFGHELPVAPEPVKPDSPDGLASIPDARGPAARTGPVAFQPDRAPAASASPQDEAWDRPVSVPLSRERTSHDLFYETRIELMQHGTPAMFTEIRRGAEAGDVEAAFRYAMVLMHCDGAPENLSEAEAWVDQIPLAPEAAQEDENIRAIIRRAAVCAELEPRRDRNIEAFRWLVAAADGGHMAAMMAFGETGVQMLHPTWFKYPEAFEIYRERTPAYLRRLLRTGHPEAFYRMAQAIYEDALFEYHGPTALAYAMLADSEGHRNDWRWDIRAILEGRLSPGEQRQAARLARSLCERYCVASVDD